MPYFKLDGKLGGKPFVIIKEPGVLMLMFMPNSIADNCFLPVV